MSSTIPTATLVVVADGSKAIQPRNEGPGSQVSLRGGRRLSPTNLLYDGPSGSRPEEQTQCQTDKATFAKQLAEVLRKLVETGAFEALVLVADPQTLGQIRDAMHRSVDETLLFTCNKELTDRSVAQIE
jgi:protein required for attachment to host cells